MSRHICITQCIAVEYKSSLLLVSVMLLVPFLVSDLQQALKYISKTQ